MERGLWEDLWGITHTLADLAHNDNVRFKLCDLTASCGPLGAPCGHVVKKGTSEGVWCWSCSTMFWEEDCVLRLVPSWPEADSTAVKSLLGGMVVDVDRPEMAHCRRVNNVPRCTEIIPGPLLTRPKVTCVDAPTGYVRRTCS